MGILIPYIKMLKIVKFGGSSVANSNQFKKVKEIVLSDDSRQFVVISASGKGENADNKITDLLFLCRAHLEYNISCDNIFDKIVERFISIKNDLNLTFDIEKELDLIKSQLNKKIDTHYLVSRGEYLTALLMAEYLGYKFADAKDIIFFNYDGSIDYEKTKKAFADITKENNRLVIPGFYGSLPDNTIKIMSRGGGDVTGSIIANIINADVYENWTDVSGILTADPRIIKNPKRINSITYSELRELSYMGASVLHEEAIFPVKEKNIPIHILNTNDPNGEGTYIFDTCEDNNEDSFITGIAGKKDFTIINITKSHMQNKLLTVKIVLDILDTYNVPVEHIPTGIDSFSVIVDSNKLKPRLYEIVLEIKKKCDTDDVTVVDDISLIATVGRNMKRRSGISGRLFSALGRENINIYAISQTNEEINIIVGVTNNQYENTIKTIYNEFIQ
ncbi:aspartate kinase [Fusobacterium sp. PH5-44]|uniref:aspartate kinase n=1 Tax=unclassified Fusobacterium TaxID=2648384 RepID=UPI003D20591B